MELHRLLADQTAGPADLHLGGGDRRAALLVIGFGRHHGGEHRHAARLLERDEHVDGAMLQHLEAADRYAELPARAQVFDCELVHRRHRADGFGRHRGDRLVDHPLDQRQGLARLAEHRLGSDLHLRKGNVGSPQTIALTITR